MEPKFQTSFIPKKPIGSSQLVGSPVVHEINIFSLIATIFFVVTILTYGGLLFYKGLLQGQIEEAGRNINTARSAFQLNKIQELITANSRITMTNTLLEKHVVVSKLFLLLQELTMKKIRFDNFVYSNKNGVPNLSMKAESQTYNALAEQEDAFSKNEFIKNPQFSNFGQGVNGLVTADFISDLDPTLISYKKAVEAMTSTQ